MTGGLGILDGRARTGEEVPRKELLGTFEAPDKETGIELEPLPPPCKTRIASLALISAFSSDWIFPRA